MSAILAEIVCPLGPQDVSGDHPLRRPSYWETYIEGFVRSLTTLGVHLVPPSTPCRPAAGAQYLSPMSHTFATRWRFSDGQEVTLGVCYADHGATAPWPEVDALLVMRCHRRVSFDQPRFPIGLPLSVGWSRGDAGAFLGAGLAALRAHREARRGTGPAYFNEGHFRVLGAEGPDRFPNRTRCKKWLQSAGIFIPKSCSAADWHTQVASFAWTLNLCGEGNCIDRKVVELCAIGTAILSDRGLEDLELPWGGRFRHGENIWFIDRPDEVLSVPTEASSSLVERLCEGSRKLYEESLAPDRVGAWAAHVAREMRRE